MRIHGLYAMVDNTYCPELSHLELANKYLLGGAPILQLRMKGSPTSKIKEIAKEIQGLKKEFSFLFLINDHPEMAKEIGADGVHLGQDDLSVKKARQILGPDKIIGQSTHNLEEARRALEAGVEYIACGAIFPTKTKPPGHPVIGLEGLKEILELSDCPVVAIGGIHRENINEVLSTGVSSIALISALTQGENITAETGFYHEALSRRRNG